MRLGLLKKACSACGPAKIPAAETVHRIQRYDRERIILVGTMSDEYSETRAQRSRRFLRWAARADVSAASTSKASDSEEFLQIARAWRGMAAAIFKSFR
jgi:hypothetical protein